MYDVLHVVDHTRVNNMRIQDMAATGAYMNTSHGSPKRLYDIVDGIVHILLHVAVWSSVKCR